MAVVLPKGYINKKDKGSSEYEHIYREGIELLQQLSGANWTDYNEHDPGITILENIAYTLTNLSFKADLSIEDILRESKGNELQSGDNGMFIPSEILTSAPITIADYIKLFIDNITNFKNAFISNNKENNLKGLYNIYVELYHYEDDVFLLKKEKERVINEVTQIFHKHRNLCEDLYSVTVLDPFYIEIELELDLEEKANGEDVFAKIFYTINDYLNHEPTFSSLSELRDENDDINNIFNGPLLKNGFIPDSELRQWNQCIYSNELMKLFAKEPGVISILRFGINYQKNDDSTEWLKEDMLPIPKNSFPVLRVSKTNERLSFKQEGVFFKPEMEVVNNQISYIDALRYGSFKSVSQSLNTVNIPQGDVLEIASYYSIREQFPVIYGIGEDGLETGLPPQRYAQANQLKAYLLPFDQLMANFLAQLTNIYQIFDVKSSEINSRFYQKLADMSELVQLIKKDGTSKDEESLYEWEKKLKEIQNHFDRDAIQRLNEVADNLLARFSEHFPTNALRKIAHSCYGNYLDDHDFEKEILQHKRKLIENYGHLSYNRARGENYSEPNLAFEIKKNSSGIIQKIGILIGLENVETRWLTKVVEDSGVKIYHKNDGFDIISEKLELVYSPSETDAVEVEDIIIIDETVDDMRDAFYYQGFSENIFEDILKEGIKTENYSIKQTTHKKRNFYYILYNNALRNPKVAHIAKTEAGAKKAIKKAIDFLVRLNKKSEGFYLIEHILLAPPFLENHFGFSFQLVLDACSHIDFVYFKKKTLAERNNLLSSILKYEGKDDSKATEIYFTSEKAQGSYILKIKKGEETIALSKQVFATEEESNEFLEQFEETIKDGVAATFIQNIQYLSIFGNEEVDEKFFCFNMSFVLPSWPVRFQDSNFRSKFNSTVYENAPAHIAFHSFWLDFEEMIAFETCFFEWYDVLSKEGSSDLKMEYSLKMIKKLKHYHHQYCH